MLLNKGAFTKRPQGACGRVESASIIFYCMQLEVLMLEKGYQVAEILYGQN